ncbi:hypothetical protein FOMPIDRAFT_1125662 [Fomitopsis schrenkii]|uniref:Cytochrome P450 n=1 Tax=Fomitopsis schrenkii TaxID=2126942 RepID=S8FKS2_FOMSC|nr:hypothetical protein FOMPIDRAFT_1125662 [Fomitopsis schrenkii]
MGNSSAARRLTLASYRPERWQNSPEAVQGIPGVWGQLSWPRACIGYRFALVEMTALLFTLIRELVFELAIPAEDMIQKSVVVQRLYIKGKVDQGSQLLLVVELYQRV